MLEIIHQSSEPIEFQSLSLGELRNHLSYCNSIKKAMTITMIIGVTAIAGSTVIDKVSEGYVLWMALSGFLCIAFSALIYREVEKMQTNIVNEVERKNITV